MNSSGRTAFLNLTRDLPVERFEVGQQLMRQGEEAQFCFIVLIGSVAIEISEESNVTRRIASRGVGEIIGELSLFQNTRCATVVAETNCECARISHAALLETLSADPNLSLALLSSTMNKARWAPCSNKTN